MNMLVCRLPWANITCCFIGEKNKLNFIWDRPKLEILTEMYKMVHERLIWSIKTEKNGVPYFKNLVTVSYYNADSTVIIHEKLFQ